MTELVSTGLTDLHLHLIIVIASFDDWNHLFLKHLAHLLLIPILQPLILELLPPIVGIMLTCSTITNITNLLLQLLADDASTALAV